MFHQQKNLILRSILFNFDRFLDQVSTSLVETRIYNFSQYIIDVMMLRWGIFLIAITMLK